jgi:two-component system response regulator FlrC
VSASLDVPRSPSPRGHLAGIPGQEIMAARTYVKDEAVRELVGRSLAEVERWLIIGTLDRCLGNRTHAARLLGISIRTLRNKLHDYAEAGFAVPQAGPVR